MTRAVRLLGAPLLLAVVATACDGLVPGFFRPATEVSPDRFPPRFADPMPGPEIAVVAGGPFTIDVSDPSGDGAVSSGIDPAGVEVARLGGGPLPATVSLPRVTVDVSTVENGQIQIAVSARDRAGNSALYIFSHVLDTAPPELAFPLPGPPAAVETAEPERSIPVRVSVDEPHFESGAIEARTPGPDDACGTADDGAIPSEILPNPDRPIPAAGTALVQYVLDNPVDPGGAPRTDAYCWVATAVDSARAPDGTPGVNVATIAARTEVTWLPPGS